MATIKNYIKQYLKWLEEQKEEGLSEREERVNWYKEKMGSPEKIRKFTERDLLSIKIPLLDLEIQQKIVSEIQQRKEKSNQYKEEIKKLREEIDNLIYKTLKQGEYGFY